MNADEDLERKADRAPAATSRSAPRSINAFGECLSPDTSVGCLSALSLVCSVTRDPLSQILPVVNRRHLRAFLVRPITARSVPLPNEIPPCVFQILCSAPSY
jgi:hypothetical protein